MVFNSSKSLGVEKPGVISSALFDIHLTMCSYCLQAMILEDYRCIVTRILDKEYTRKLRMAGPVDEFVESLECCYIFAEPLNAAISNCEDKV